MSKFKKTSTGKRARRSFTDEFKAGAVRLVLEEGKGIAAVARVSRRDRELVVHCEMEGLRVKGAAAGSGEGLGRRPTRSSPYPRRGMERSCAPSSE